MASNKRLIAAGAATAAAFDPLQNFETVTYTGNGGTQKITGYIRKGAAFKDYTSYIQTTLPSSSIYAISFWMYFESGVTSYTPFGTDVSSGAGDIVTEVGTNGSFSITVQNKLRSLSAGALGSTGWKHIAYSSDQTLYINGVNQTGGTTTTNSNPSANLLIGGWNYPPPTWGGFNSKLDQIRVFNRNLTTGEVTTLYGETYASSTKSTTDIFGDGSGVALYELDDSAKESYFGQAFDGDGGTRYISTGVSNNDIEALSFWLYFESGTSIGRPLGSNVSSGGGDLGVTISTNGTIDLHLQNLRYLSNAGALGSTGWKHIYYDTNRDLYINGTLNSSGTDYTESFPSSTALIGGLRTNFGFYNERIDDVRFYSSTLTSTQIDYLANHDISNLDSIPNLLAHFKLDGNAIDETGTYTATEVNTQYSTGVYGGTATNVNFLGMAFQPDLVWTKTRSQPFNHSIYDSVRGVNKLLQSNTTIAEFPATNALNSFDSNGFTLGANDNSNTNGESSVAWCWKAGGAAVSNTDGGVTSQVSANTAAGFSIATWTYSSGTNTVGHGLNSAPELIIYKKRSGSQVWLVFTTAIDGSLDRNYLDASGFANSSLSLPTDSVFSIDTGHTGDYVGYCFHSVDGYQKVGSYTSPLSVGTKITTGFRPRFLLIKADRANNSWHLWDSLRDTTNPRDKVLRPNTSDSELDGSVYNIDFVDDGFEIENTYESINHTSATTYIYLAIA